MTCADAGVILDGLKWRYWAPDIALAVGTSHEKDCTPDCATGGTIDYSVNVVLWGVQTNGTGPQFTEATVTHVQPRPADDPLAQTTYDLTMYNGPQTSAPSPAQSNAAAPGYGGVEIGMTQDALRATGHVTDWSGLSKPDALGCVELPLTFKGARALYDTKADRVDTIFFGPSMVTPGGIKIGASADELQAAYPNLSGAMFDTMAAPAEHGAQYRFSQDDHGVVDGIGLTATDERCWG